MASTKPFVFVQNYWKKINSRQDEFHDRLQELQLQSKRSREELAVCKNEVTALEKRLQAKEAEAIAISKEVGFKLASFLRFHRFPVTVAFKANLREKEMVLRLKIVTFKNPNSVQIQLEDARNETNDSLRRLTTVERELQQTKQQYREQEEELQRKTSKIVSSFCLGKNAIT